MSSEKKKLITFDRVLNVVVLIAAATVLLSPNNALTRKVREAYANHQQAKAVLAAWSDLVSEGARMGSSEGEVVAVEFADYQCPFCKVFHTERWKTASDPGAVLYRHLPLTSIHPHAEAAALASICAEEQDAFQSLHDFLMEEEAWDKPEPDWTVIAEAVGLEVEALTTCMASGRARARLDRDLALATQLGLTGTPSFVMADGSTHSGVPRGESGFPWEGVR